MSLVYKIKSLFRPSRGSSTLILGSSIERRLEERTRGDGGSVSSSDIAIASLGRGRDLDVLLEYSIGVYRVFITREDGEYRYNVELDERYRREAEKISREIREIVHDLIMRIPDRRIIDERGLREVVKRLEKTRGLDPDLVLYMVREELGYKKLTVLLEDPYVEDISVSGPGYVWVRHSYINSIDPKTDLVRTNVYLGSVEEIIKIQQVIASKVGRAVSYTNPILDIQLPPEDGGHRIHLVGVAVSGDRPEIVIRKNTMRMVSIEDLIQRGMLSRAVADYLRDLVMRRGSLIIAGPPGSGKTTLLRAILNSYVPRDWKVVIIEDTPEIEIPPDSSWVRYSTYENGIVRVDQYVLTKAALRSSANRIIVIGETRGSEARVLAQALNMGMGALTTFHGGSTREVIVRLMSPPISLRPYQILSIQAVAVLAIENNKRVVRFIDEIVPGRDNRSVRIRRIYDRDRDNGTAEILSRSYYTGVRVHQHRGLEVS